MGKLQPVIRYQEFNGDAVRARHAAPVLSSICSDSIEGQDADRVLALLLLAGISTLQGRSVRWTAR